jgi:hypothetical protein
MAYVDAQIFTAMSMIWAKRRELHEVSDKNFHDYEKFGAIVFDKKIFLIKPQFFYERN